MSWLKEKIARLLMAQGSPAPLDLWHSRLFENVDGARLEGALDQRLILLQLFAGTWERVERTAAIWSDEEAKSAVQISRQLSHLYLCLLYPRETLLSDLASRLEPASPEARLCLYYGSPDSDYRHIRNALAHGTFTHGGHDITFRDRAWSRQLTLERLELDCLVILDLIFDAGARINKVVFDAHGTSRH